MKIVDKNKTNSEAKSKSDTLRRRKKPGSTTETNGAVKEAAGSTLEKKDVVKEAVKEFTKKHPPHPHPEPKPKPHAQIPPRPPSPFFFWIWLLLHSIAIGVYVAGWILQNQLHTSIECEMTYSQRQLIPIPLPVSSQTNPKYSLHKFIDQRDPRPHHKAMLNKWLPIVKQVGDEEQIATQTYLKRNNNPQQPHCSPANDTVAVLYIPGHWGSYMQSRSIGAHGIQLTGSRDRKQAQKVTQALANSEWSGSSASVFSEFTFDVYAVNFQEEGAALHGLFLWEQTAFVAQVVQELVKTCQLSQVLLLGHSIGGYVARLVPALYPETRRFLPNIVTLGSPHAHPVFGWEPTVYKLHQAYLAETTSNHSVLVAISGGLRDEMIPPVACRASHGLSILAPEIMEPGPKRIKPIFGMDHRAIVWCHNLLSVVRGVIYNMVRADQNLSPSDRLEGVQSALGLTGADYEQSLVEHQSTFMQFHGLASSIAMESAMLYHLELLVGMFVALGCFHSIGTKFLGYDLSVFQLLTTICLAARTNYQIHLGTVALLALVANVLFRLLHWVMGVTLPSLLNRSGMAGLRQRLKRVQFLTAGIFLGVLGLQCNFELFGWPTRFCLALLFAVYFGTIATAIVTAEDQQSTGLVSFAATFLLLCPFLVAGKIIALLSETSATTLPVRYSPDRGLLILAGKLLLPIVFRVAFHHSVEARRGTAEEQMRGVMMTLAILYFGLSLFQIGEGYRAGNLLATISWMECFFLPILL